MFKELVKLNSFKIPVRNTSTNTVDCAEINFFKRLTSQWWDETGQMKPLHRLNKLRVPLIRDGIINTSATTERNYVEPLKGFSILDVGCGAGILCEPLARIGATVTGLDASCDLIEEAKSHAQQENLTGLEYVSSSIEEFAAQGNANRYDAVVASEIIEHVTKKEEFLKSSLACLKPGGSIFLSTLNKTCLANFAAVFLAEKIFKLTLQGTHEYDKFIAPHKLQRLLEDENCKTVLVHGMGYNVLTSEWFWTSNQSISYALHAVKLK